MISEDGYSIDTLEGYLRGLQQHLGADPARTDVSSILRLPDTMNCKYPDRPRCHVVHLEPGRRFNLRDFDDLLPRGDQVNANGTMNPPGWADALLDGVDGPDTRAPGAVGRDQAAAKLAGRCLALGFSPAETLTFLEGWNRRNRPPLPAADLARVVQSIAQTHRRGLEHSRGGSTRSLAESDEPAAESGHYRGLELTTVGELLAESDAAPEWLVESRIIVGGLVGAIGKPKSGKTTLLWSLTLAVARGEEWLGHATRQGPVIYLALEEKRDQVKAQFRAMGSTDADDIRFLFGRAPTDVVPRLRYEADHRRPALIVVDTLFRLVRVRSEGGNDYATMTAALEPLLAIARETGAALVFSHHAGKGGLQGSDVDTPLGSTAIAGSVDTLLVVRRGERHRTLSTVQRYGQDLEPITLDLDPVTRIVRAGVTKQEADVLAAATAIFDHLCAAQQALDEPAIHDAVEGKRPSKVKALRRLVAESKVWRAGTGKKGDPYLYASDARFLVPGKAGEPENQNLQADLNGRHSVSNAGSREIAPGAGRAGSPEPAFSGLEEVPL